MGIRKQLLVNLSVLSILAAASINVSASDANIVRVKLSPSSEQLKQCLPSYASLRVKLKRTTDAVGYDSFNIRARYLPPNTSFTVFLLEQAGSPFGAAEYIGDFTTNDQGYADNTFKLIVEEAFASTLVDGTRVRVDLNRIGVWFADPKDDDFCLGTDSKVTPFDGDAEAGVQFFNSAEADALP